MAFNESALEQPYMGWDDVVSSEAYRSRNNEERLKTFDTWSEYNVAYRQKQMGGMDPDTIQRAEPNLKEEEEWMTSKREQLSGKYSIPGLLEREEVPAEDSGRVIDILQDTEGLKQNGFSDNQITEARDKVWDAYGESFKFSQAGPTGQLSDESDEDLKKRFWEDPTVGDNLNNVWNQFANNTYTVVLRSLAGISDLSDRGSAMLANAGSMLGLPEDEKYSDFEGNKDERFFGGIANWARQTSDEISAGLPSDPRLGRYTQAAIGGATQMPAQLVTAPFTAVNAVFNYGQMYEDNYQTFTDAHARAIYDEAVSAGRVAPETSFDIWESRLTDEEKADINGAAAWKAAVVAVPQAALETVMDKFLINGIPLEGIPGGKVIGSLMSWGRRTMPKMTAAAAVFGSATAKGLGESVTEGLQDFPKNVVETAIEGRATGVSDFLARSFKDLDLSMVGGFSGGFTAGGITANTTLRQERAAQWAIGMVDQNSDIYKQGAARVESTKQQTGEQSLQYKEASRNFEALQDQAHWVLNKLGDPKSDANRAAVADERAKATKAFRNEFSNWAKQNGFENALAAGENNRNEFGRKVGEIRGRFANLRRAAQTQGLTQTAQAIDEAERIQIAEAAKQLGESQKEAQDAVNAFIGSVDQSGPGRAAYARAEVMRVFPNFAFSGDFKNDDVVTGILDALESREINADTDLAAWLQKEIPSTKVEDTVVNPTTPKRDIPYERKVGLISDMFKMPSRLERKVTQEEKKQAEISIAELTDLNPEDVEFIRGGNSKVFRNKKTGEYIKLIRPSKEKLDDINRQINFLRENAPDSVILPNIQPLVLDQEGGGAFLLTQNPAGVEGAEVVYIEGRSSTEKKSDNDLLKELFDQNILGGAAQLNGILRIETGSTLKNIGLVVGSDGMVRGYGFDFDGVTKAEFDKSFNSAVEITRNTKPSEGVPLSSFSRAAQDLILSGQTELVKNRITGLAAARPPATAFTPQNNGQTNTENQASGENAAVSDATTDESGTGVGSETGGTGTVSVAKTATETGTPETSETTPSPVVPAVTKSSDSELDAAVAEANTAEEFEAWAKKNKRDTIRPPEGGIYAPRAFWEVRKQQQQTEGATPNVETDQTTVEAGTTGETAPESALDETQPTTPPTAETAAIVSEVEANPQAHSRKTGRKTEISREAAVAALTKLPEGPISRRQAIELGKTLDLSGPRVAKLAAMRGDAAAVPDILAGKYDAELSLFDRATTPEAPATVTETKPETVKTGTDTAPEIAEKTPADRWVAVATSAFEKKLNELTGRKFDKIKAALKTEEGRAEIQRKLAGIFSKSLDKNLLDGGVIDPVERAEAVESALYGKTSETTGELTKNVLSDLATNLEKTGDPFQVLKGVSYDAWSARGRDQARPGLTRQSKRGNLVTQDGRTQEVADDAQGGRTLSSGTVLGGATSTEQLEREARLAEYENRKNEAIQETALSVAEKYAAQLGESVEDTRLAIAKLLKDDFGVDVDVEGLGWRTPGSKSRVKTKLVAKLKSQGDAIFKDLATSLRSNLAEVTAAARADGLLQSEAARVSSLRLIDLVEREIVIGLETVETLKDAADKARSAGSIAPLEAALRYIKSNEAIGFAISDAVAATLNNGKPLTDPERLSSLTNEDLKAVAESPLLPEGVGAVLSALTEVGGDPLDIVSKSSKPEFRLLASILKEARENTPRETLVYNFALLPQLFGDRQTAQGYWWSNNKGSIYVSPFSESVEGTALHEYLHALVNGKLDIFLNDPESELVSDTEREAFNEMVELKTQVETEALQRIADAEARGISKDALRQMRRDLLGGVNNTSIDLSEFLNESLNHQPFQQFLSELKSDKAGKSLYAKVLNAILRFIVGRKVAADSALQRAFELTVSIATDTRQNIPIQERNPTQVQFIRRLQARMGRPLTVEEVEIAARDFAIKYPHPASVETEAAAAEAVSGLSGAGVDSFNALAFEFVSPNEKENLTFEQALAELNADQQGLLKDFGNRAAEALGITGSNLTDAIGDWTDGAEPTTLTEHQNDIPYEDLRILAALKGAFANQKAVIPFKVDPTGEQFLYELVIPGVSLSETRDILSAAGLQYRTLIEQEGGTRVIIFDADGSAFDSFADLVQSNNYEFNFFNGRGEFLGTESRTDSKEIYAGAIAAEINRLGREGQNAGPESAQSVRANRLRELAREAGLGDQPALQASAQGLGPDGGSNQVQRQNVRPNAEPNPLVQESVDGYNRKFGLGRVVQGHYAPVNEQRARTIAAAYEALPVLDNGPETLEAYSQLALEIQRQWDFAINEMGVTFEPWTRDGQPYANSREMVRDVRDNKRLWFFTGGEPHPLLNQPDENGLTMNDKLRAIHDLFGHAAEDYQFGPRGEENAWIKHSQMFSPLAQRALTTETRGQNSWVNYGPQNFAADGTRVTIPASERPFAVQKVALLPEQFMDWQGALNETPAPSASQPAAAPTPSRLSPAERDQAITFLSQTDLQTSNALDILSQMAQPDWMSITERLPTTALMRLAQAVDGVSRPFYEGIRLEVMSIVRRGLNRTVAQRTASRASSATTPPGGELSNDAFESMMEAREYVRRRFLQAAKALKTDIYPNLGGYTAHYIVSNAKGEHFIEYNPYDFVGLSRAQVDATMREELIHAASGLVLQQKGIDWEDFYRDLGKSLTKKQRAQLKQVYTSADTLVDVGAEYFRAGVQKLLYGTITEQELGDTPMQKIVTLLKDVVAYFRKSNVSPAVREIYEETVKMVRRADPKFAAGGPSGSAAAQTSAPDLSMQATTTYLDGYQRLLKGLRDSEIRSFKEKSKFLTEPERAKFREDTRRTFLDIYKSLPSEKEFAAAALGGQAKRGWYENSTKALIQVFGTDAPRFAALLAATSPQTSVENNLINALNTWKNWTAQGRPTDRASIVRIMGESVMGNKGEDSVLDAWINNSVRALASEFPEELTISGPKVNSFMLNLRGFVNEVTNDAWMANFALVDQVIFSGSLNVDGTDPGKRPGYLAMSARVRAAADYLTKLTGETWTPAEVQETVWSWAKTLYELQERKGETRDALEILQAGELTDEAIAATPDFATLLNDGDYKQILEEAGYGESLAGLAGLRSGPDGGTKRAFTTEAGSPAAKVIRAGQERAASRLAKLYQLRAQESERNRGPAPKASAPSFASAPVPGFVPSTFGPDARTTSEALYRIRFMSPDYAPIGRALADKTHFKWTEAGTLDKALEFIDVAHKGDLKAAFYASENGGGLTSEQAVMVQGFVLKRTQGAANVARSEIAALVNAASTSNDASEKSKILRRVRDLELVRDLYQQDADAFADRVADAASQAGSELRAFRLLADTLVPRSWVRQYTRPIVKVQANKVKSDKTGRDIMASLISARRAAANKAAKRIDSLLKQAAKGFLPKKLTQAEIEAATQVARMLAAPIPVRDQIINAAVEDAVIQGLETIKRGVNPQQKDLQSILNVWEKRLRDTATDQLNKAIEDRLSGGMVASPQPTLTEDEKREAEARKLADFWREFSDLPFAETVFNVAQAKISSADTPYASLVKGVQFDPASSNILKRTVRGSINISEEIRKTADERGLTVDVLKARLAQHNPSLTDTQLVRLAEAVEKVYNAEVQEAALAALERIKKVAATPQEREIVDNKVIQRLLPLVNMGVFSDEAAYNAVAEKYNLPTYDEATVERLETMATELQALPEGSFQRLEGGQRLALEILRAHFSSAKGKQKFRHMNNIASAFWTAAILSAPPTQIVNASMTSVSVFLESMAEATGYYVAGRRAGMSRGDARQFFSDASRAWLFAFGKNASNTSRRAIDEAYTALKKGTTRFKSEKMEDLAPLEMFDFDPKVSIPGNAMMEALSSGEFKSAAKAAKDTAKSVGKTMGSRAKGIALGLVSGDVNRAGRSTVDALKDYAATMKLVGRMMLAADAVNSTAASSSKQMMMRRYFAATQEGLSSSEVETLMAEIRDGGNQNLKDMAMATAEDEAQRGDFGPKGTRDHEISKARRVEQIIEQQTYGPEIMAKGRDFAAIASFNSEPYGVVGWFMTFLFGNMNKVGGVILKPINPFPKTVSNLLNAALNYTPYGNLRAQGWNLSNQVVFDEDNKFFRDAPETHSPEWYAAHARGLAGSAALVLLGMMVKGAADERDEGRVPWFEIFGAGPKTARERRQWREAGGVQFSIKMGNLVLRYTDWPGLSIALGLLGTLYDNHVWGSKEQTFVEKLFVGMTSVVGTTLNRNMLGGASVVFDMISSSTSDDQKQAAWARYLASYPQGFIRPAMIRWAETIATGNYQENRSLAGWLISQMPVVGAFRGRPSLNVLGEPIQISAWDATAGRLVSLKDTHLILSPLTDANLFINPAQSYKLVDPSATSGLRDMAQLELYDYSKLYGEELRKVLTPALVENLVKMSRQNPEAAQDNLNEIALGARNRAQGLLRAQRNFQKAPRR